MIKNFVLKILKVLFVITIKPILRVHLTVILLEVFLMKIFYHKVLLK